MKMPRSIRMFEVLYLGAIAIGGAHGLLFAPPLSPEELDPLGSFIVIFWVVIALFTIAIIALALRTSRRKSRTGKWILTVITALGLGASAFGYQYLIELGTTQVVVTGLTSLMQVIAIYLLFRPSSEAWFASRYI
jgi:glucan phosphoethanolaminetransferase (alkaline phosphatase superfamily)